jgi:hypothetical protein
LRPFEEKIELLQHENNSLNIEIEAVKQGLKDALENVSEYHQT